MFRIGTEAVALLRAQRLNALYRIIPRGEVKRVLAQTGRHCRFCPRLPNLFVVYFVLALGLFCTDCYRPMHQVKERRMPLLRTATGWRWRKTLLMMAMTRVRRSRGTP